MRVWPRCVTVCEPIGVVQRKHRGLVEDVGGPAAGRVVGIALDLGGPARVAFHQQADRAAGESHRGGEEQRLARHDVFRRIDIGHDVGRGAGFTEQPLKPASASDAPINVRNWRRLSGIGPDGGLLGKLPPHQFLEGLAAGQLLQAAPVLLRRCAASAQTDSPRASEQYPCEDLSCGSSVARRATGDVGGVFDVVLLDELAPSVELIGRRLRTSC